METLIMNLLGGAAGGIGAGKAMKNFSMGTIVDAVLGILGGGLGGQLLGALGLFAGDGGSAMDIQNIAGNVLSSGVGGGALMAIVGVIKNAVAKK